MANELFFRVGSVNARLAANDHASFWSTWKWKLDPYIIKQPKEPYDLFISMVLSDNQIYPEKLLREEKAGFFCHRVYSTETGDILWQYERIKNGEIVLKYLVSPSWDSITLLEDNSDTNGQLAFEYLGQMFPYAALNHNVLTFHGVLVEYRGYGVIISASSGVGKTTRARLWRDYKNALIINGDRAACQKTEGVWTGYGLPWSGTSGEQINRSIPLKALVVLERGGENEIRRMSLQESFGAVLPHLQCPTWDAGLVGQAMEQMDDFLQNVPILHLSSRPDTDAIDALCKALEEI